MNNSRFKNWENKLSQNKNILIMLVGDSITWGENHCTCEETFCAVLARMFAKRFPKTTVLRYDGIVEGGALPLKCFNGPFEVQKGTLGTITFVRNGVGGDTVKRALNRSTDYTGSFITGEYPDLIISMFGINDALSNDPSKFILPDEFYRHLKTFVNLLKITNPTAEQILITPTYNDSGKTATSCLDPYSDKVIQVANEEELLCIDAHTIFMNHLVVGAENYGQQDWLSDVAGDSAHLSPKGSCVLAELIYNNL